MVSASTIVFLLYVAGQMAPTRDMGERARSELSLRASRNELSNPKPCKFLEGEHTSKPAAIVCQPQLGASLRKGSVVSLPAMAQTPFAPPPRRRKTIGGSRSPSSIPRVICGIL